MSKVDLLRQCETSLSAADETLAALWREDTESRTPRLADVVSLIDRARIKVRLELKRLDRLPHEQPAPGDGR